jgi:hypothetical protein
MEKPCKECERRENIGIFNCSFREFYLCSCGAPVLTGKESNTKSHSLKGVEGKRMVDMVSKKNRTGG